MKNLVQFDGFLRYTTFVFGIMNILCGIPIATGVIYTARSFVPIMMSQNFDSCGISMKPTKFEFSNNNLDDDYYNSRSSSSSNNNSNTISGAERLYNIVFGLLATFLGFIRLVGFIYWNDISCRPLIRILVVLTYSIEVLRDFIMVYEGYIDIGEAIALLPSTLMMICIITLEYLRSNYYYFETAAYDKYDEMISRMSYGGRVPTDDDKNKRD